MKRIKSILCYLLVLAIVMLGLPITSDIIYAQDYNSETAYIQTPVGLHGELSVKKLKQYKAPTIVDESYNPVQLRAVSTHGIQWFPQYVNKEGFQSLRDEWGINTVRLAVYPREGGYLQGNQSQMDKKIQKGVKAAKDLGMYIIIDWHVLSYNPNEDIEEAKAFFEKYATMYKDYNNVIFEICNEPTNTPWYNQSGNDLYTYCKEVCKVIRDCGNNSIIICGTNDWSQRVDEVSQKPLKNDGFENIMYSIHFYAATHYDNIKNNFEAAIDAGTPVFASEFGCCDASGNGAYDFSNADDWMSLFVKNNVSYACWSLCNKAESASCISPSCDKTYGWTENDLTDCGVWLINTSRRLADIEEIKIIKGKLKKSKNTNKKIKLLILDESDEEIQEDAEADKTKSRDSKKQSSNVDGKLLIDLSVTSDWGTGLTANASIINDGSSDITGWTVEFDFDGKITNLWCGKIISRKNNHYIVKPETYNETVCAGSETSFGFTAEKNEEQTGKISNIKIK